MLKQRLKELRKRENITQVQFANIFDISAGTIAMWETGKREPDIDTLIKIADYFNVSVDFLLGKSENKKQPADENISELDKKLINLLLDLSPDEVQRVRDFVQGLKANREANSSQNQ